MSGTHFLGRLRSDAARRAGFVLLALSLVLAGGGDLLGRHHCAHHDGAVAAGQETDAPAGDDHGGNPHGENAHGENARGVHAAAAPDHTDGDDGHAGPCTCIGTCHGSAATPLPPRTGIPVAWVATAAPAADQPTTGSAAIRLLPYVLPFPNGPPAHG